MWINEKILWGLIEKSEFRRGVMKKPIYRGDCLKRELGQFADLKGGLAKRRVMVFLRRIPRCVTRGWGRRRGRGGVVRGRRIFPAHFQNLEKSVLILGDKMPIVVI